MPTHTENHQLPHNLDAEKAVLGSFYLSQRALAKVQGLLSPDDFFDPRHREIYRAVLELVENEDPIDPMIVIDKLDRLGKLEKVGGAAYVTGLEQSVISPGNVEYHANIVKADSTRRYTHKQLLGIAERAQDPTGDLKNLMADIAVLQDGLARRTASARIATPEELAQETYDALVDGIEKKGTGIPSGIPRLERITNGWQRGDLNILAARPSVGKTALALQFALHALKHNIGVIFFSLEMDRSQLVNRLISQHTGISGDLIRRKNLDDGKLDEISEFLEVFSTWPIFIDDATDVDAATILSKTNTIKARSPGVGLVIIDYLQLMDIGGGQRRYENRNLELARISRGLKKIARDLDVAVICLSQLNREVERAKGRAPCLSDLRDSGAIEQDADIVALLNRLPNPDTITPIDHVDLHIAKHRNGGLGKIPLVFLRERTLFIEEETIETAPQHKPHWAD